jgi:hypothetical protein
MSQLVQHYVFELDSPLPCCLSPQQQKAADGAAVTVTGDTVTRRTCYQQELFEKLSSMVHTPTTTATAAAATAAAAAAATVQLRALQGLPLLLQGFTGRLQAARHRRSAEAAAAALAAGNSASSSSRAKHVSGSSRVASAHPGALPFKFWAALSRTLVGLFDTADQVRGCELYCMTHYFVTSQSTVCTVALLCAKCVTSSVSKRRGAAALDARISSSDVQSTDTHTLLAMLAHVPVNLTRTHTLTAAANTATISDS